MKIFKHMKKTILLALLIALGAASAVAQGGDIQVKGKIDGIKKGRLYLVARSSRQQLIPWGSVTSNGVSLFSRLRLQNP